MLSGMGFHLTRLSYAEVSTSSFWRSPLLANDTWGPPVVALGKFDALHRGHQSLAISAVHLGGTPYLLSFDGMAEVLGWEKRLPLVAHCDRQRVLKTWEKVCCGAVPAECRIPFAEVRTMSPEEFVELLVIELGVKGIIVGSNYRFGYKAAGTACTLKTLGDEYGIKVQVVNLLERDANILHGNRDVVSSSRIRQGLSEGDLSLVEVCLGRQYRLVIDVQKSKPKSATILTPKYLNQPPCPGTYRAYVSCSHECSGKDACKDEIFMLELETDRLRFMEQEGPFNFHRHRYLIIDFVS